RGIFSGLRSGPSTGGSEAGRSDLQFPSACSAFPPDRDRPVYLSSFRFSRESQPEGCYSATSRNTNLVLRGILWAARRIASRAISGATPSISNSILPGRITATHSSGAPLPLPIRVSAGFLVIGLSGKRRIQTLPPRLMKRVIAIRAASIWRAVIQPHSMALRPYSPKEIDEPRHAFPVMRPRCTLRNFTFLGINIVQISRLFLAFAAGLRRLSRLFDRRLGGRHQRRHNRAASARGARFRSGSHGGRRFRAGSAFRTGFAASAFTTSAIGARSAAIAVTSTGTFVAARFVFLRERTLATGQNLAFVEPRLHADHAVGGARFGKTVIDIGAQRVQRKLTLEIPFAAGDFSAVQTARHANLDAFAAEPQRGIDGLAHRAAERHALFELQRNGLRDELCIELRLVHFLDVDEDFAVGLLRERLLQLFDLRALAADDDAGPGGADGDAQLVAGAVDFNRADAGRFELLAQAVFQFLIFLQEPGVIVAREPARPPRLVEPQPEAVRMNFLTHSLCPL